ncbi:hypothetical protein L915_20518, partial [Phytophthora nicotianae]
VALSETQQSKIAETEKSKVAAVFAQADLHQQQVLARNAEIKALRQTFTDKDTAYSTLQGAAAKHFEQQQKSARLLNSTNDQSLRHTLSTIENQRAVITRQKRVIARQGYISMHGPTWRLPLCGGRIVFQRLEILSPGWKSGLTKSRGLRSRVRISSPRSQRFNKRKTLWQFKEMNCSASLTSVS